MAIYTRRVVPVMFWIVWGWVCAALGSLMFLPQVVRLLRSANPAGLSLLMWQLNTAAAVGWTVHGAHWGSWNVALPNAIIAVCAALVVHMIQTSAGLPVRSVWLPVFAVASVLVAIEFLTTPELYGLAVLIPQAFGMLSQSRDLVRSQDLGGLSPLTIALSAGIQYLWLTWAIGTGDPSVVICASVLGVMGAFNVIWFALRTRGHVRALA